MLDGMKVERVSVNSLALDPENARKHSPRNVEAIAASLQQFGQRRPLVVWSDTVIAGNGTLEAAKSLGWEHVYVARVPQDWTRDQARAYAIADNRTAELAEWDTEILVPVLEELNSLGMLEGTGFSESELNDWRETLDAGNEEDGEPQGSLLALADITVDDPTHEAQANDVWKLHLPGSSVLHTLVVCSVIKDWNSWVKYLQDDALFVPFPDPYVTHTDIAKKTPLVLVQPDTYLAASLLDKHVSVYGEHTVVLQDA